MEMMCSVTAMYIFAGYRDAIAELEEEDMNAARIAVEWISGAGELEVAQRFKSVEKMIDGAIDAILLNEGSAGIWEYEVAERIGRYLVKHAQKEEELTDNDIVECAIRITRIWNEVNGNLNHLDIIL
ncbi:hypothetical protein CS369_21740 (plasmid) [Candidatus Symbiopectobacterium sp. 'North America']|uniref:hypothetical protein n=1 Tax=Candidatus Symbiopectobacterium sp. 'North America' TaxID=2794574 RepID=UPI0018C8FCB3|nr:hypothetical protein [Candidatus Symbiopectobacterium sp. 'North America']MBG6246677.1 hypothetical protein [Candidatus Symbiopectobacterium sp. 'North America']